MALDSPEANLPDNSTIARKALASYSTWKACSEEESYADAVMVVNAEAEQIVNDTFCQDDPDMLTVREAMAVTMFVKAVAKRPI